MPCVASFVNVVQAAYKGDHTKLIAVEQLLNVASWLKPHNQNHVHYHHEHLGFKFSLDKDNVPGFMFKTQPALESDWRGVDGVPNGPQCRALKTIPTTQPESYRLKWKPEPSFLKTVQDCMEFLTPAQQDWLRSVAASGDFRIIAEDKINSGAIGQEATVSVGPCTARLQTIRNFPQDVFAVPASPVTKTIKNAAALQVQSFLCLLASIHCLVLASSSQRRAL